VSEGGWRSAHQVALLAAAHAHGDLGIPTDGYIDVFAAIRAAGVPLIARPMKRLFGAYLGEADCGPGIVLNSDLRIAELRHTAAHELGHHRRRHGRMLDETLDPLAEWSVGQWSTPEREAEAFAAWFMMPRAAVHGCLAALELDRPRHAGDVYRIAQLLGVSYRGLARHLVHLRLASEVDARAWAGTAVQTVRRRLAGGAILGGGVDPRSAVHVITPGLTVAVIHVSPGDVLIFRGCAPMVTDLDSIGVYLQELEANGRGRPPDEDDATAFTVKARFEELLIHTRASPDATLTSTRDGAEWRLRVHPLFGHVGLDHGEGNYDFGARPSTGADVGRRGR
jgi:Zn-dependent peptidase ImmA (M78 family)